MLMPDSTDFTPTFSGHETFALRGPWLKKAYDLLKNTPDLFLQENAFVHLGVGKNMAQSIRYWGRVCGIFDRSSHGNGHGISNLGHALFNDDNGWDPYLVSAAARWLLHWQIAARPQAAFSWFYTYNLLRAGEFSAEQLAAAIFEEIGKRGWRRPSPATLQRDIDCLLSCYVQPDPKILATAVEDALACPLLSLDLLRALPGERRFYLVSGWQPDLPDALVAFAILTQLQISGRRTIAFGELAYAPISPGRVFRLTEDSLLERLMRLQELTNGRAYYSDQAGIRQVFWHHPAEVNLPIRLLNLAFAEEGTTL